jgi:hypothetical protein
MGIRFFLKIIFMFFVLSIIECFVLLVLNIECKKIIENMIQFMLLNIAALAFYTWNADNRRANIELAFEFDKRWEEKLTIIGEEFRLNDEEFHKELADKDLVKYLNDSTKNHKKIEFLLKKIEYYENKNPCITSYIDIGLLLELIIKELSLLANIVTDKALDKKTLNITNGVIKLHNQNYNKIQNYIKKTGIYKDYVVINEIEHLLNDLNEIKIKDTNKEDVMDSTDSEVDVYTKEIGKAIGHNRYFKPSDKSIMISTSCNWNDDVTKYGTWYAIPKEVLKDETVKKDYYFVVREENERKEFPFLFMSNDNLKNLIEEKKNKCNENGKKINDNLIHFYFQWNKNGDGGEVSDERSHIPLDANTYKVGKAKLKDDGKLYIKEDEKEGSL